MDDEAGVPPVIASKPKDAPKEEPADNSPSKPAVTGTARGTLSTSKPSKGKRKLNEETKAANGAPPKKVKIENVRHFFSKLTSLQVPFVILI